MGQDNEIMYHFRQLTSQKSAALDGKGLKKTSLVSDEFNTQLYVFIWSDANKDIDRFQLFFFEKVLEWSRQNGTTSNITNRLQPQDDEVKTGARKGSRTFERVDDPALLKEAIHILEHSVFPPGIKENLLSRIDQEIS